MKRVRRGGRVTKRVRIGAPDPSLTATSGVAAVGEFLDKLDVMAQLDRGVGSIKKRERGASAGELLVCLAKSQLLGADALVGLDRQRQDVAGVELSAVPVLASTTAECDSAEDICGRTHGVYEAGMEELAAQWPRGVYMAVDAGHELFYNPEAVAAIRQLINATRDPSLWESAMATPESGTPQP